MDPKTHLKNQINDLADDLLKITAKYSYSNERILSGNLCEDRRLEAKKALDEARDDAQKWIIRLAEEMFTTGHSLFFELYDEMVKE